MGEVNRILSPRGAQLPRYGWRSASPVARLYSNTESNTYSTHPLMEANSLRRISAPHTVSSRMSVHVTPAMAQTSTSPCLPQAQPTCVQGNTALLRVSCGAGQGTINYQGQDSMSSVAGVPNLRAPSPLRPCQTPTPQLFADVTPVPIQWAAAQQKLHCQTQQDSPLRSVSVHREILTSSGETHTPATCSHTASVCSETHPQQHRDMASSHRSQSSNPTLTPATCSHAASVCSESHSQQHKDVSNSHRSHSSHPHPVGKVSDSWAFLSDAQVQDLAEFALRENVSTKLLQQLTRRELMSLLMAQLALEPHACDSWPGAVEDEENERVAHEQNEQHVVSTVSSSRITRKPDSGGCRARSFSPTTSTKIQRPDFNLGKPLQASRRASLGSPRRSNSKPTKPRPSRRECTLKPLFLLRDVNKP